MQTVIIIGAGASGMMSAISARKEHARVILIDHKEEVGKKILATGNGRCNFTNIQQEPIFYRSELPEFPWHIIEKFNVQQTIAFFLSLGIYSKNRSGYLYPYSDQAVSIRKALELKLMDLGVEIHLEEEVTGISQSTQGFCVKTSKHQYKGDSVILATGSKALPSSGSDGSGYELAKTLGHHIIPVVPALTGLKCKEKYYKGIAGIRIQAKVSIFCNEKYMASDQGEVQLTKYGISGIPVFQISRYASKALYNKQPVFALLDFMPDFTAEKFYTFLEKRIAQNPEYPVCDFLNGIFPSKLATIWYQFAKIDANRKVHDLSQRDLTNLIHLIKEFRTTVVETNDYSQAQICAGGIDTREVNPDTLESNILPGLYFAGELLDVDGICGGYNLQWAWSSGFVAGKEAAHA